MDRLRCFGLHQSGLIHSFAVRYIFPRHCKAPNFLSKNRIHPLTLSTRTVFLSPSLKKEEENRNVFGKMNQRRREALNNFRMKVSVKSAQMIENIYTIPNALTISRIVLTPIIGGLVIYEYYSLSLGLFCVAGITDFFDGIIARRFPGQQSVLGSVLDPMADKILISVLYISLAFKGIIPVPLTVLVLLRDAGLVAAAIYVRYISLPPPKTFARYWDAKLPTAQAKPTFISKVNTAVQLILVAVSLPAPVFGYLDHPALQAYWILTGCTTVASGLSYVLSKNTVEFVNKKTRKK